MNTARNFGCLLMVCGMAWLVSACIKRDKAESASAASATEPQSQDELSASEIWDLVVEFHKVRAAEHRQQVQNAFFTLAGKLHDRGRLRTVLGFVIDQASDRFGVEALVALSPDERQDLVIQLETAISAEIEKRDPANGYPSWQTITETLRKALGKQQSAIGDSAFYEEMAALTGARWVGYKRVRILRDGTASFAERDRLIQSAKQSLWIAAWAFYDDKTGEAAATMLKAAKARGVDVRIMVDGQIAQQRFADDTAKGLQLAGIPVLMWRHPKRPFHGMHRKVIVVDGQTLLLGGMNFGNEYSHRYVTDAKHRWRDTDALFEGDIAVEAAAVFAERWNYIVAANPELGVSALAVPKRPEAATAAPRAMYVDHEPTESEVDLILLATLKLAAGATKRVDISNAYYIATIPTEKVLLEALGRKVKLRLHTNSSDSVDLPTLIRPIYRGLVPLQAAGARIFLQRGATLHSKWMVADDQVGWIGSYNLHPRSSRYETESIVLFDDPVLAKSFHSLFDADASLSMPVTSPEIIALPTAPLSDFGEAFFFDQL